MRALLAKQMPTTTVVDDKTTEHDRAYTYPHACEPTFAPLRHTVRSWHTVMLGKRQRLHIDPHYCAPTSDGRDPTSSSASSSSPPFTFSPPSDVSSSSSHLSPMSAAGAGPSSWHLSFVLCLYDFESTDPDHLPFRRNEILEIVKKEDSGWWAALRDDRVGWVPSAFVTELTEEAAVKLRNIREEFRVYEYEAELLYSSQPFTSNSPFFDVSLSPSTIREKAEEDSWIPLAETEGKVPSMQVRSPSGLVVKDFPDDVAPLSGVSSSPYSHLRADSLDSHSTEPDSTTTQDAAAQPVTRRLLPAIPTQQPSRPTLTPLYFNKPTPPTPAPPTSPSPTPVSPRSYFARSRSDSAPLLSREARVRPIMANDFSSLSRISVLLDSQQHDADEDPPNGMHNKASDPDFERLRPNPIMRRSDKVLKLTGDDDAQAFHNAKIAQASLPWYLKPSYSSDDIKMEYDGSVRAGTLSALVERLTADPLKMSQERVYRDDFFTTFTTFTTARDLFDMLVDHYKMGEPPSLTPEQSSEWRKKRLRSVHTRVLSTLSDWVEKYGLLQDDPHVLPQLRDFLGCVVSPPSQALTAKLLLQQIDKMASAETGTHTPTTSPAAPTTPSKRRKNSRGLVLTSAPKDLLRLDPAELAAQLTLYEYRLYAQIRPRECLLWTKKQEGESVARLAAFCATHARLASWVTATVLANDGIKKRAEIADFWVKVAEKCRALNNFSSMSAIVAALSSTAVNRLHLTWAHAARSGQLTALTRLTEPRGNFAVARTALTSLADGATCVPFVGMFLTDIVHIHDQLPDRVKLPLSSHRSASLGALSLGTPTSAATSATCMPPPSAPISGAPSSCSNSISSSNCKAASNLGQPLLNFVKRHRWAESVRAITRYQTRTPAVVEDAPLLAFIAEQLAATGERVGSREADNAVWTRSQELQQSEISQADIRRGLEAVGF